MWVIGSHRQVACHADWRLATPKRSGGDGELRCDADCGTDARAEERVSVWHEAACSR